MKRGLVLAGPEGEKYWLVGDHITVKVKKEDTGGECFVASHHVEPGGGPPPHIHQREDELFYLYEGKLSFVQGSKTFVGGAGTAVWLKRGVVHTFESVGTGPAKFLVLAVPGNFGEFVVAAGEPIDRIPCDKQVGRGVIEKVMRIAPEHDIEVVLDHRAEEEAPPRTPRSWWVLGELVTVKLTSVETDGRFCVAEVESWPGGGVPAHLHRSMDEFLHVIEGEYEFMVAGRTHRVRAGGMVYVPRGVVHSFRNSGATMARLADFLTPGGFEKFFEQCGVECVDRGRRVVQVPTEEEMRRMADEVGMEMVREIPKSGRGSDDIDGREVRAVSSRVAGKEAHFFDSGMRADEEIGER